MEWVFRKPTIKEAIDEIASYFDTRAEAAKSDTFPRVRKTMKQQEFAKGEYYTWRSAAEMLRNCQVEIVEVSKAADPTAYARKRMVDLGMPEANSKLAGKHWNTKELQAEFTVLSFAAPFVLAIRKSDGKRGILEFTHSPRSYFNWREDNDLA